MRRLCRFRALGSLLALVATAGCGGPPPRLDDSAKIIRATLRQLVDDGRPICVDDMTNGPPLAIFHAMITAPMQSRRLLVWRPPAPLRPPLDPSARTIARDTIDAQEVRLDQPNPPGGALPPLEQRRLNYEARLLSTYRDYTSVKISPALGVGRVVARWWPLNRFARDCQPRFVVSDPIYRNNIAFVTVKAGHWGTTYVLERRGDDWRTSAEWTRWLY